MGIRGQWYEVKCSVPSVGIHVQITTTQGSALSFDEIEVYGITVTSDLEISNAEVKAEQALEQ